MKIEGHDPYNRQIHGKNKMSIKTGTYLHFEVPLLDGCGNCLHRKNCPTTGNIGVFDIDDYKNGTFYRCNMFEFPG